MTTRFNQEMLKRMTRFGILICRMADDLPRHTSAFVIAKQVVRSATSVGANYREAQFARTGKEFLSKLQIALQEAEETRHWLSTIHGCGHVDDADLNPLTKECSEIIAILVSSVNTTRRRTTN